MTERDYGRLHLWIIVNYQSYSLTLWIANLLASDTIIFMRNKEGYYEKNRNSNFARAYLDTYFGSVDPDEQIIMDFLAKEYKKIKGQPQMLDLGTGPCIHHVLPAVPYVSGIVMADYLADNLSELKKWKNGFKNAHNWNPFTKLILKLEGLKPNKKNLAERERALREKIEKITYANVLKNNPINSNKKFPVIGFFYCAETAANNKREWTLILSRVGKMVSSKGMLVMCSVENASFYIIHDSLKGERRIPCVRINKNDFLRVLPKMGFDLNNTVIKSRKVSGMEKEGIRRIIVVSAKKF